MKSGYAIIFFFLGIICNAKGQAPVFTGTVLDADTKLGIPAATITLKNDRTQLSLATAANGSFSITADTGLYQVSISCIGYEPYPGRTVRVQSGLASVYNFTLKATAYQLQIMVVSGSLHEKRIQDEIVSMEVMKPAFILNTGSTKMDEALNRLPGVNIIDGQANIRGGSGYAYGAGSRVLVLVDDLPQLSADAGDVKWDFLPIENLEQVEVIKGASSTLYGSSALNGVINVRTSYPTDKPQTAIQMYEGVYFNPARDEIRWWRFNQPYYNGMSFFHSQRFGQLDLVLGSNVYNEHSFRDGEYYQRGRVNFNARYRFKKIPGLSAGINGNYQRELEGTFFIWSNDTTGTYIPYGGVPSDSNKNSSITDGDNIRFNLDPYVVYLGKHGARHALQTRYFLTDNMNLTQSSVAKLYYGQYGYTQPIKKLGLTLNAGFSGSTSTIVSQLYGNHDGDNMAAYVQLEEKCKNLTLLGGVRYETFRVDTFRGNSKPVYRFGVNYKAGKGTNFRASYGMGYRFPSIAEKFVRTGIGSLNVYPNPDILPESGWSAEIGVMQGFKVSRWVGYADFALFRTIYRNMMEFKFGQWGNPLTDPFFGIGFKSVNVENAEISGGELVIVGQGKLFGLPTTLTVGFTRINPIDSHKKAYADSVFAADPGLTQSVKDSITTAEVLKYRYKTTIKGDFEMSYKHFSFGGSARYNSFMVNIDPFFEGKDPLFPVQFIPGIKDYRDKHNKGDAVFDVRAGWNVTDKFKVELICKNLLNREYTERPAMVEQPRSLTLQCLLKW